MVPVGEEFKNGLITWFWFRRFHEVVMTADAADV